MLKDYKSLPKRGPNFLLRGVVRLRVLIAFFALLGLLLASQLVFAGSLATDGQKLSQIHEEIKNLESENTIIKVKIAQESSLLTLFEKAQQNGFVQPAQIVSP